MSGVLSDKEVKAEGNEEKMKDVGEAAVKRVADSLPIHSVKRLVEPL